jgi:hypothetical protein
MGRERHLRSTVQPRPQLLGVNHGNLDEKPERFVGGRKSLP